jgi:hypothetical protein
MESYELSEFIYGIINSVNPSFFDLKNYDNPSYVINKQKLLDYITRHPCSSRYYGFIYDMIDSVKYITCDEMIRVFQQNIFDIWSKHIDGYKLVIVIPPNATLEKSNIYYILYTLYHLRESFDIIIEHMFIGNHLRKQFPYPLDDGSKYLLIFTDDFSYSGGQLRDDYIRESLNSFNVFKLKDKNKNVFNNNNKNVFNNNNYLLNRNPYIENIQYYLNIVGWTPRARKYITKYFLSSDSLVNNFNNFVEIEERSLSMYNFFRYFYKKKLREDPLFKKRKTKTNASRNNRNNNNINNQNNSVIVDYNDDTYNFMYLYDLIKVIKVVEGNNTRYEVISTIKQMFSIFFLRNIKKQSLIYLFSKYPDQVSTYSKLCMVEIHEDAYILDIDKFLGVTGIDPYSFIYSICPKGHIGKYILKHTPEEIETFLIPCNNTNSNGNYLKKNFLNRDHYGKRKPIKYSRKYLKLFNGVNYSNNNSRRHARNFSNETFFDSSKCNNTIIPFYKKLTYLYKDKELEKDVTISDIFKQIFLPPPPIHLPLSPPPHPNNENGKSKTKRQKST